jgi:hypothetical protein
MPITPPSLGGFAITAAYSAMGDGPSGSLTSDPVSPLADEQPFTLIWVTAGVAKIRIMSADFDTGIIPNPTATGGTLLVAAGFLTTQVLTLFCFDIGGSPLIVTPVPTYTVTIV